MQATILHGKFPVAYRIIIFYNNNNINSGTQTQSVPSTGTLIPTEND